MKSNVLITLVNMAVFLASAAAAFANTTWYVNGVSGSDSDNCTSDTTACRTIGHAVSLAASGDTVRIASATYAENLTIGISLKLLGTRASTTVLDGGGTSRVVTVSSGINVTLSGVTITHGYAASGAGILNNGSLRLIGSRVVGNSAFESCSNACSASGGGITNSGVLSIMYSTIDSNSASTVCSENCSVFGGGISNRGVLTISNSTVNSDSAQCSVHCGAYGGGISNEGALTINNSTVSANSVDAPVCTFACHAFGAGMYNSYNSKTMVITNSTFTGNSGWGAIFNDTNAKLKINNGTISGNTVKGIANYGATTLQNTMVAQNQGNCSELVTSAGYNLSSDGTCDFIGPGDLNNTDPMLGPLQNNGGPTRTMALHSGSAAIDAGNPNGCMDSAGHPLKTDQRGMPRHDPKDTRGCDIGAYESQSD